jgi:hypothetical protein
MNELERIFESFGIAIKHNNQDRHVVDVLEDIFLKINNEEFSLMMKQLAISESQKGHIFDQARNKPYE